MKRNKSSAKLLRALLRVVLYVGSFRLFLVFMLNLLKRRRKIHISVVSIAAQSSLQDESIATDFVKDFINQRSLHYIGSRNRRGSSRGRQRGGQGIKAAYTATAEIQ